MKDTFVVVGIVVALVLGFVGLSQPAVNVDALIAKVQSQFGANPGPEFLVPAFFRDTATIGGSVFATTSNGTVTYTAASFQRTSIIEHTASGAVTANLPASTTLNAFLPNAGDRRTLFLRPITSNITVAGGTGTLLRTASSSKVCIANQFCSLEFVRKSNTDIEVLMTSGSQ